MERNRKLLYQIADLIETYPEMHDQETWGWSDSDKFDKVIFDGEQYKCGTAHCIAGWALVLDNDWKPAKIRNHFGNKRIDWGTAVNKAEGTAMSTPNWAQGKLGMNDSEAAILFSEDWNPSNHLTVGDALRMFADGAGIRDITEDW
jgi:hypothetical protein